MKNQIKKLILIFLILTILIISIFLRITRSYKIEANKALSNIIVGLDKEYGQIEQMDLITMAKTDSDLDLENLGINSTNILEFDKSYQLGTYLLSAFLIGTFIAFTGYFYYLNHNKKKEVKRILDDMQRINQGIYDIRINNDDEDFARIQNEMFKTTIKLREDAENSKLSRRHLKTSLEDISHQIKTPIASINLLLENLQDPDLDSSVKEDLLTYVQVEVDAITNLVKMLLNVAVLESGTSEFKKENLIVSNVIDQAIEILEPIRKDKDIDIVKGDLAYTYLGDSKWEKELYLNLIKNALDHSTGKSIFIDCKDTPTYLEVSVENEALAINEESQERIFERFYKINSTDGSYGIGLNLCKMIAENNNAKLRLETTGTNVKFIVKYFKMTT